jgi:hypothetical protein
MKLTPELGMHLVTVEDDSENVWLNTYLREAGLVDDLREVGLWIGYKGIQAALVNRGLSIRSFDNSRVRTWGKTENS